MTIEEFKSKLDKWSKNQKTYIHRALKNILLSIKNEIYDAMSGRVLNVVTGKTRNSIEIQSNVEKMNYSVDINKKRKFIARLQESGYSLKGGAGFRKGINLFETIRNKYKPEIVNNILKELIKGYKNG